MQLLCHTLNLRIPYVAAIQEGYEHGKAYHGQNLVIELTSHAAFNVGRGVYQFVLRGNRRHGFGLANCLEIFRGAGGIVKKVGQNKVSWCDGQLILKLILKPPRVGFAALSADERLADGFLILPWVTRCEDRRLCDSASLRQTVQSACICKCGCPRITPTCTRVLDVAF